MLERDMLDCGEYIHSEEYRKKTYSQSLKNQQTNLETRIKNQSEKKLR